MYRNLKKNKVYSVQHRSKVFRAIYKRRFYNKALLKWTYVFKSLDGFAEYTLLVNDVYVVEI